MMRARDFSFGRMLSMTSCFLLLVGGNAASAQELRNVTNQFKTEEGCPLQVISAKTDLEIDALGTPGACRIYLDYKNISAKPVTAAKFRISYIDAQQQEHGSLHAPDSHVLEPGGVAKQQWRGKVDPRTASVVIAPLVARYGDGTLWESEKLKELAPGTGGDGSQYGPGKGASSDNNQGLQAP